MMKVRSCVTISLVNEARGGPFVYWDDLPGSCRKAKALGFDAVEIFPPGPDAVDPSMLKNLLADEGLELAAVGTGAGWVKHKLQLALPDDGARLKARAFVTSIIDFAGPFGAPAIIGSMQGRSSPEVDKATHRAYLIEALNELSEHARQYNVPLIYEPLNRYETDVATTIDAGLDLLNEVAGNNIVLLADLFHMNIEEINVADALFQGGKKIGHVHFVDSNRRAAGFGHTDFGPIVKALQTIGYDKYLSAEAYALPDSDAAAEQTIKAFNSLIG